MSAKTKKTLCALLVVALLAIAPASGHAAKKKKVKRIPIRTCSQEMKVTDVRFSARAVMGIKIVFDDIGCAVIWRNMQGAFDQAIFDDKATTRDFDDLSTIKMSESYYVVDENLITPIKFGIAAFKDIGSAKKYIDYNGNGKLLGYKQLIKLDLKPPVEEEED